MHVENEISINETLIEYAEKILFSSNEKFTQERRTFISDFETLDLKAVPGSGKTTLLLAKLIIMEQSLPLTDGRAVLVLSHTNTAVNEINSLIKNYCPKLFSHPNHIGTIQSFVNKYLAVPYYESCLKKKVISIDTEYYNEYIDNMYANMTNYKLKDWLKNQHEPVEFLKKIRFNNNGKLVAYINGTSEDFILKNEDTASYKGLVSFKWNMIKSGILHYDDAYFLANMYLVKYPIIKDTLRKRFSYVFVDEMQDMDIHQIKILEELFEDDQVCYQRLGDNNQAIYINIVHSENIWSIRSRTLCISGSYRLSKFNAELASRFALDGIGIEGLNNATMDYKPVLVVYNEDNPECKVIEGFSNYITTMNGENADRILNSSTFKVISWRKENDSGHLALKNYCPDYEKLLENSVKEDILYNSNYIIVRTILNRIGDICFHEGISYEDEKICKNNIRKIFTFSTEFSMLVDKRMYLLIVSLSTEDVEDFNIVSNELLKIILERLNVNSEKIEHMLEVYTLDYADFCVEEEIRTAKCVKCNINNCVPILGTVHSVKGETHDVTLFLESYYKGKYESDILYEVLINKCTITELITKQFSTIYILEKEIEDIRSQGKSRGIKSKLAKIQKSNRNIRDIQQYSKLVYVALSRAKSIVGYAIGKSRFEKYFDEKDITEYWDVLYID